MYMTLNHTEEVKDESKEATPIDIYMDTILAVEIIITFKDTNNARHTRRIFYFMKQGVQGT
jgi:hypothetical protein